MAEKIGCLKLCFLSFDQTVPDNIPFLYDQIKPCGSRIKNGQPFLSNISRNGCLKVPGIIDTFFDVGIYSSFNFYECVDIGIIKNDIDYHIYFYNTDRNNDVVVSNIVYSGDLTGVYITLPIGTVIGKTDFVDFNLTIERIGDVVINGTIHISFSSGQVISICIKGLRSIVLDIGYLTNSTIIEEFKFDNVFLESMKGNIQAINFETEPRLSIVYECCKLNSYDFKFSILKFSEGKIIVPLLNYPLTVESYYSAGSNIVTVTGVFPDEICIEDFIILNGSAYQINNITFSGDVVSLELSNVLQEDVSAGECVYCAKICFINSIKGVTETGNISTFNIEVETDFGCWSMIPDTANPNWIAIDDKYVFPFRCDIKNGLDFVYKKEEIKEVFIGGNTDRFLSGGVHKEEKVVVYLSGVDEIRDFKRWVKFHAQNFMPFIMFHKGNLISQTDVSTGNNYIIVDYDNVKFFLPEYCRYVFIEKDNVKFYSKIVDFIENNGIVLNDSLPFDISAGHPIKLGFSGSFLNNYVRFFYRNRDFVEVNLTVRERY